MDDEIAASVPLGILALVTDSPDLDMDDVVKFRPAGADPSEACVLLFRSPQSAREWVGRMAHEGHRVSVFSLSRRERIKEVLNDLRLLGVTHVAIDPDATASGRQPIVSAILETEFDD